MISETRFWAWWFLDYIQRQTQARTSGGRHGDKFVVLLGVSWTQAQWRGGTGNAIHRTFETR